MKLPKYDDMVALVEFTFLYSDYQSLLTPDKLDINGNPLGISTPIIIKMMVAF